MSINDYDDVDESIECQLMMVMIYIYINIMNHCDDDVYSDYQHNESLS